MNKKFKLIFGSVVFLVGALLIVFSPSHFITTILMLIGIIFILNALIKRKVVFLIISIILTVLAILVYINIHSFRSIERIEQQVNKVEYIEILSKLQIAAECHVKGIPYTFILDEENRIVAKNRRGKELEKKIDEMLKKKKE